ncbi:MAG: hypothetical protein DRQ47_10705, partial [Gammaproteobacteria bacterium]
MNKQINRRSFLKNSLMTGIAGSSMLSSLGSLNRINAAIGQNSKVTALPGYRALVCIFLHGGNDGFNLLVPRDNDNYNTYLASRQNLAINQEDLLPITPISGGDFGLNPAMGEMQSMFQAGNLAIQSNVGTLIEPVTREQIHAKTANLPPKLFS